jgi:hypothetical protein
MYVLKELLFWLTWPIYWAEILREIKKERIEGYG